MAGYSLVQCSGVDLLKIDAPAGFAAFFSTRSGGISTGPYDSLNMGLYVNDDRLNVLENRYRFIRACGLSPSHVVAMDQVHGIAVTQVRLGDAGRGILPGTEPLGGADGLVTATPGLGIVGFFADCVPIYLFAKEPLGCGLAHAGWKGTVRGVATEAVKSMLSLGAQADRLHAVIGPSICGDCYEVGENVIDEARKLFGQSVPGLRPKAHGKWLLDLKQANAWLLQQCGVAARNITILDLCTSCRSDLFFSHRRDGPPTGRMAAMVSICSTEESETSDRNQQITSPYGVFHGNHQR